MNMINKYLMDKMKAVILILSIGLIACSQEVVEAENKSNNADEVHAVGVMSSASTVRLDGSVIVTGGIENRITNADIICIKNGEISLVSKLSRPRYQHTQTKVSNETILVIGGYEGYGGEMALSEIEEINPITFEANVVAQLKHARGGHISIKLNDGRILIMGGSNGSQQLSSAELYDPETREIQLVQMNESRSHFSASKIESGEVVVFGGYGSNMASIEKFNPSENKFTRAGSMQYGRFIHASADLGDGRILIAGGYDGVFSMSEAEIYDVNSQTSRIISPMSLKRDGHSFINLSDNRVLVLGGANKGIVTNATELFDPTTESFSVGPSLDYAIESYTVSFLSDEAIMIYGGTDKVRFFTLDLSTF